MYVSTTEINVPEAMTVSVTEDTLAVQLSDGRDISVPLSWYPRLVHATPEERGHWELIGGGQGIHWPALDEDISVEMLLAGRKSGESRARAGGPSSSGWKPNRQVGALRYTSSRPMNRLRRTHRWAQGWQLDWYFLLRVSSCSQ